MYSHDECKSIMQYFIISFSSLFFSVRLSVPASMAITDRIRLVASPVDATCASHGARVSSLVYYCCHSHCSQRFDCDTNLTGHMRPMNVRRLNYLFLVM